LENEINFLFIFIFFQKYLAQQLDTNPLGERQPLLVPVDLSADVIVDAIQKLVELALEAQLPVELAVPVGDSQIFVVDVPARA
jgi:hypothetical protein